MLNSLIGLGAFPLTSALAGEDACGQVLGETKWEKGKKSRNRFFLSLGLLNVAPFVYFALLFQFMGAYIDLSSTLSIHFILQILFIGFLSLSVFAFYNFFLGLVIWQPCGGSFFYTEYELNEIKKNKTLYNHSWSYIVAGFIYPAIPWVIFVFLKALCL